MATFGYGRVSTSKQTPENQRHELEQAGYKLDYWFADVGVSGKVPASHRAQFAALLERIRDGETLVVAKLDRLGRDIRDILATVQALLDRKVRVVVHQLGGIDLGSTAGKVMLAVLAAVAEMERDLTIERTHAAQDRARSEGRHIGRPPVVTQEQRAEILARRAAGESYTALAKEFDISRALIYKIEAAALAARAS